MRLHIDIETYSSRDIRKTGSYHYMDSPDFEILLFAYALDDSPVSVIDFSAGENLPKYVKDFLLDPAVEKHAFNATFERNALKKIGYDIPVEEWHCTMIKSAFCGLPLSLADVSKALKLEEKGKLSTGKALIKYFCTPCKPTIANGKRTRNYWYDSQEKWLEFIEYNKNDVIAEREIYYFLKDYNIPEFEKLVYHLDQKINDRGILVDLNFAENATVFNKYYMDELKIRMKEITGVDNPNSPKQLKEWLSAAMGKDITSLAKANLQPLIDESESDEVGEVLQLRRDLAKTSIKKYIAMKNCAGPDNRARGLFQHYGANRTGRWAGRLIQLQNLPRNYMKDLALAREIVSSGDYDMMALCYDKISDVLSQLIRTSFIAPESKLFAVADFSAIEARVIAWFADEKWRLDVFNTHGKIYEASASIMFNIPIEQITKGSEYRYKGKVAELALGYQGSVGAMKNMGGKAMGLSESEMKTIVTKWRNANKKIVNFWQSCQELALRAVRTKNTVVSKSGLLCFSCDENFLTIELPSGRKLYYAEPFIGTNKWGQPSLAYKGMIQATRTWGAIDTYGGKLVENIVQATARDLLAQSMVKLDKAGFTIVMHVHDEVVCEVPENSATDDLAEIERIMGEKVKWAPGLPLGADGYVTPFYKKD